MATATTRQSRLSLDTISVALKDDSMEHIRFLQRLNLLASDMVCSCGTQMNLGQKSDLTDGHIFRCSSCKTTKSVRYKEQAETISMDNCDLLLGEAIPCYKGL